MKVCGSEYTAEKARRAQSVENIKIFAQGSRKTYFCATWRRESFRRIANRQFTNLANAGVHAYQFIFRYSLSWDRIR